MKVRREGVNGCRKMRTAWRVMLMAAVLVLDVRAFAQHSREPAGVDKREYYGVRVSEVINGCSLRLENGEILRLIGVETPENVPTAKLQVDARVKNIPAAVLEAMGKEAAAFLREMVDGKPINVEFDTLPRDLYGALSGYVFVDRGKIFVNAEIIKRGYTPLVPAAANTRYQDMFEQLYQAAHARSQGIWHQWQK